MTETTSSDGTSAPAGCFGRFANWTSRPAIVAGAYLLIGLGIYWQVILDGVFVIDDFDYVVSNPATIDLRSFLVDLHELRYVGYLSFALNRLVGGLEPTGYHLLNALIHIANAGLVAVLASMILSTLTGAAGQVGRRVAATLCGLVFLVHPLQTQAVSYISQRFTCLATLFYLACVVLYLVARLDAERRGFSARSGIAWSISAAACLLAMKTKEIAFTIPVALVLLEAGLFQASRFGWRRWAFLAPYLALLPVIPLSLFAAELGLVHPTSELYENMRAAKQADLLALSPYVYFITQLRVLMVYLSRFVFPVGLRAQYDFEASGSLAELPVLGSLAVLLALAGLGLWLWLRARSLDPGRRPWAGLAALGIGWFFVTASVESSFIPIKHLVFEHRMYLPSVGLVAATVGLGGLAWPTRPLGRPGVTSLAIGVLIAALAAGTYVRNRVWTDAILFWTDVIEKSPRLLAGWHNRAVEHRREGNLEAALADLDHGASHIGGSFRTRSHWPDPDLNPENVAKVYGVRASLLANTGQSERAQKDFYQALAMVRIAQDRPLVLSVLIDIADAVRDGDSCETAVPLYSQILAAAPGTLEALYHRGWCAASAGRFEEGLKDLDAVLRADPTAARVYADRAKIHRELGRFADAQDDLEAACSMGFEPACASLSRPQHAAPPGGGEPAPVPDRRAHGF